MLRTRENIKGDLEFSLRFASGDKGYLTLNDFLEFHNNMYWVQSKENLSNFYNVRYFKFICR